MNVSGQFVCRFGVDGSAPDIFMEVCKERGWQMYDDEGEETDWNLWWRTCGFTNTVRQLQKWQFVNYIPSGNSICKKDTLARNLKLLKKLYGEVYNITPGTYSVPLEYTKLVSDNNKLGRGQQYWICKPVDQCQGKGIYVFQNLKEICFESNAIVQKYIQNPLLIRGYKFDLRLYVCVPSFYPLTIYLYKEGLVRFATEKYTLHDLQNPFRHLTNCSLNKASPGYLRSKEGIGAGCKWSFQQLRLHLKRTGVNDWLLWQNISSLITLTVLSHCSNVPRTINSFQFYGFDVLIDNDLKPWLLEVNVSPALSNDCHVDPAVKKPLLHDLFDLLGLPFSRQSTPDCKNVLWGRKSPSSSSNSETYRSTKVFVTRRTKKPRSAKEKEIIWTSSLNPILKGMPCLSAVRVRKNGYIFGKQNDSSEEYGKVKKETLLRTEKKVKDYNKTNEFWPQLFTDRSQNVNKGFKGRNKLPSSMTWGNGKNWTSPVGRSGDWTRIYPLGQRTQHETKTNEYNTISVIDQQIKDIVSKVIKYRKVCVKIYETNQRCTDEELNCLLMKQMGLTTEVWLPNSW